MRPNDSGLGRVLQNMGPVPAPVPGCPVSKEAHEDITEVVAEKGTNVPALFAARYHESILLASAHSEPAAAQFGWKEHLAPWDLYKQQRTWTRHRRGDDRPARSIVDSPGPRQPSPDGQLADIQLETQPVVTSKLTPPACHGHWPRLATHKPVPLASFYPYNTWMLRIDVKIAEKLVYHLSSNQAHPLIQLRPEGRHHHPQAQLRQ